MTKYSVEYYMSLGYDYGNASEAALAYEQGEGQEEVSPELQAMRDGLAEIDAEIEAEEARRKAAVENTERMVAVEKWLNNYNGNFEFYLSLKSQFARKGTLSVKQIEAVERAISRDNSRVSEVKGEDREWSNPTYPNGTLLKISANIARKIAEEKGYAYPFMNVEVVKTHIETPKAIFVTIKFTPQIGRSCGICGRGLDTEISRATGIGPVCADKMGLSRYSVGEAKMVLTEISEKLNLMGEVKLWLPKSKIKAMGV